MITLMQWGDRYYPARERAPARRPPPRLRRRGHRPSDVRGCGAELGPRDVVAEPGPGALAAA